MSAMGEGVLGRWLPAGGFFSLLYLDTHTIAMAFLIHSQLWFKTEH